MRQEIKNDVTIKRIIKENRDGTVEVELSTGQTGTIKRDFLNGGFERRAATPKPKRRRR